MVGGRHRRRRCTASQSASAENRITITADGDTAAGVGRVGSAGGTSIAALDLKGQVAGLKAQVEANRVALEAKVDRNHNTVIDWINKLNERQGMLEAEEARQRKH